MNIPKRKFDNIPLPISYAFIKALEIAIEDGMVSTNRYSLIALSQLKVATGHKPDLCEYENTPDDRLQHENDLRDWEAKTALIKKCEAEGLRYIVDKPIGDSSESLMHGRYLYLYKTMDEASNCLTELIYNEVIQEVLQAFYPKD